MSILMEPRYSLIVNGTDLAEFGVYTSGEKAFDSFEKELEFISIPGRSGDLVRSNKRKKNGTLTYSSFIAENLNANIIALRNFLDSLPEEYVRIEDDRHPDEYLMGIHTGVINFTPDGVSDENIYSGATFELQFNVKPYRYLISGDTETTLTANGSIENQTLFTSKPLIKVFGNGTLTVTGDDGVAYGATISGNTSKGIFLDCETQNAYEKTESGGITQIVPKNANVSLSNHHQFPVLKPGTNRIIGLSSSTITKIIITPRWYRA